MDGGAISSSWEDENIIVAHLKVYFYTRLLSTLSVLLDLLVWSQALTNIFKFSQAHSWAWSQTQDSVEKPEWMFETEIASAFLMIPCTGFLRITISANHKWVWISNPLYKNQRSQPY